MRTNGITPKWLAVIFLGLTVCGITFGVESGNELPVRFQELVTTPSFDESRVSAVGRAINFQTWPKANIWRVAPRIDKSFLSNPELVTRENISYYTVPFQGSVAAVGEWSWRRRVQNEEPLPTELPPERKQKLMAFLSREGKLDDPNFVEEFLNRKLESYRRSKKYYLDGTIDVRVCLAPNSLAAQEYLLSSLTTNSMMTKGLVRMYATAKQPEGLGTISFSTGSRVSFVRDNICVRIRAKGCFANEALPLAHKIDAMLLAQPTLTYQELLARRPSVTIAANVDEAGMNGRRTVSYDISVPPGQEIVSVRASIDGQSTTAKDGKITLADKSGTFGVKLTVITNELLATTFERELIIDE